MILDSSINFLFAWIHRLPDDYLGSSTDGKCLKAWSTIGFTYDGSGKATGFQFLSMRKAKIKNFAISELRSILPIMITHQGWILFFKS